MPTEAQRRANRKQDAARGKRAAVWIDHKTLKTLDRLRGKSPRAAYVRQLIEEKAR